MKRAKKTAIIAAVVMILVGIAASVCAVAAMGFDLTRSNTLTFQTNTYTVEETFTAISVEGAECDIALYSSEDGMCKVVCQESDKISHTVSVKENTLTIARQDDRKWYERMGVYWGRMEIAVYLPQTAYESLRAKSVSGDISVPDVFSFGTADIQSTSGSIFINAQVRGEMTAGTVSGELYIANVHPNKLTAETTSGNIQLVNVDVATDLQLTAVSGDIELSNVTAQNITASTTSGDAEFWNTVAYGNIHMESVSGDIELDRCDADWLWLKAVSGDVSGSLLTDKIFLTDTTSGNIHVPRSTSGGECQIITTSGNIEFQENAK